MTMTNQNLTDKIEGLKALCLDYSRGTLDSDISKAMADKTIRGAFIDILGTETPSKRDIRNNQALIYSIIEVAIEQRITEGWGKDAFFDQFVEERNLALGDTNEFYVADRTRLHVSEIARGNLDLRRQTLDVGKTFSIPVKTYGVKVYDSILRLVSGRGNLDELITKAEQAFLDYIKTEVYITFMGIYNDLPDELKHTGSLSEDELINIAENVSMVNQGHQTIIAGTRQALRGLKGTYVPEWISEDMKKQRNTMGNILMWEGYELMVIPQVSQVGKIAPMIDNDRLFILSLNTKPVKFVREGDILIVESGYYENYDLSTETAIVMEFGVGVILGNFFGMYKIVR